MTVVKTKKGYVVKSKSGKTKLSRPYKTKAAAVRRLGQIEHFKKTKPKKGKKK